MKFLQTKRFSLQTITDVIEQRHTVYVDIQVHQLYDLC